MSVGSIRKYRRQILPKNFVNVLYLAVFSIWRFDEKQLPLIQIHC